MGWRARRGGNPDANQDDRVALARRLGASVTITSQVGHGFVDAVVGFRGTNDLWEIKREGKAPARRPKRKKTGTEQKQERFDQTWFGKPPVTIETAEDVVRALLAMDLNRRLDYSAVCDDLLATVMATLRGNLARELKGLL